MGIKKIKVILKVNRQESFEEFYKKFRDDNKSEYQRKIYGELVTFRAIGGGFTMEYYGITLEVNFEEHKVYELEVTSKADISLAHGSLQDMLGFINGVQKYALITVINRRLCEYDSRVPIKKQLLKSYMRLNNDKKEAYKMINNLIPRSYFYSETYFDLIGKSKEQIMNYINKDKKLLQRLQKKRIEVLN